MKINDTYKPAIFPCAKIQNRRHFKAQTLSKDEFISSKKAPSFAASPFSKIKALFQEKPLSEAEQQVEAQPKEDDWVSYYRDLVENPSLSYNPLAPECDKLSGEDYDKNLRRIVKASTIEPLRPSKYFGYCLDTKELKDQFLRSGKLDITLSETDKISPVHSENALLGDRKVSYLGRWCDSEITTSYGRRIGWSNEKIARDIMQNFYDGHGNTLDGVRIEIVRKPDDTIKIKISGKGLYEYKDLQLLGSGTKEENPYNAGSFGEGTKVLVANLLGNEDTSKITYSCADWRLSYAAPEEGSTIIRRKLQKMPQILEGNNIEFETKNEGLALAIIDSINYFNHSQNPDFKNLMYDSKDFGFNFLPKGQGGNIYLIQRFEFGKKNAWDNNVSQLNLVFKRKPEAKEYEKITGTELPKDRDRTFLNLDDIHHLSRYFANKMTDEELLQSLISSKPAWGTMDINPFATSPFNSFLQGIVDEIHARGIAIDFEGEKFATMDRSYGFDIVGEVLSANGYTIVHNMFNKIGIESGIKVFDRMSVHRPLEPSEAEIKKLKLLEEGLKIVQQNILKTLKERLLSADVHLNGKLRSDNVMYFYNAMCNTTNERQLSYQEFHDLSDEEYESLCEKISTYINAQFRKYGEEGDAKKVDEMLFLLGALAHQDNMFDVKSQDYLRTIQNLRLIKDEDIEKPRYIFDRNSEISNATLGEAIIKKGKYEGHWVDREYLNSSSFNHLMGTWVHEICHKIGPDGSIEFSYALTDMMRVLLEAGFSDENHKKFKAIEEIFNNL